MRIQHDTADREDLDCSTATCINVESNTCGMEDRSAGYTLLHIFCLLFYVIVYANYVYHCNIRYFIAYVSRRLVMCPVIFTDVVVTLFTCVEYA